MSIITSPMLLGADVGGPYQISRSLRFNAPDSAYLSRTPASAGNRKTWTWAGWVKRSALSTRQVMFSAGSDGTEFYFGGSNNDQLIFYYYNGSSFVANYQTTALYRDPSAWQHILISVDTTQATATNRFKIYVNGVQVTVFSTETQFSQNSESDINAATAHNVGRSTGAGSRYFDGYLADIYFIDGQALDPTSFTETDATTGQLIPKAFSGTYGTNGFHLDFADNSAATATTLGKDTSGNGNNWTPNNLSVTAGAGNDSLVDVPTNGAQTDTGVGGEVRGSYATLNPLQNTSNTLSDGNLSVSVPAGTSGWTGTTIAMTTGKWYTEFTVGTGVIQMFGVCNVDFYGTGNNAPWITAGAKEVTYYASDGRVYVDGVNTGATSGATAGDVISIAFDADARSVAIRKNNTLLTTKTITANSAGYTFYVSSGGGACTATLNYGARPFAYTAPSGYKALCTTNLPAPLVTKPSTVMDVALYTGNGSTQTISGLGFSPDLVWLKGRSVAYSHQLYDQVRGAGKLLNSDSTNAESTVTDNLTAFTSTGFTLGNDAGTNQSSATYVGWAWDAGSSTVTNTQGSITSTVRANATAGFSVVTYTGTGSNATVGHGLGVAPFMFIVKNRSTSSDWDVYHGSLPSPATNRIVLQSTAAAIGAGGTSAWNSSSPTSTVVSLGASTSANANGNNHVMYCFAPVSGYSSFGSYTPNDSADGPFVYTGFRPKWVLIKAAGGTGGNWWMFDSTRDPINVARYYLLADSSGMEADNVSVDFVSNGFKIRTTSAGVNLSTRLSYVYAAFAESPFNYSRAR